MTAAALLLLGLGPLTAATLNVTTNADPACPCMDVRAFFLDAKLTATGGMAELLRSEGSPCNDTDVLDYQSARSSGSSVTAFCYPANYGSSRCSAWDAGPRSKAHACSASRPPAYCSQRWCCASCTCCGISAAASDASERRPGAATALGKPELEEAASGRPAVRLRCPRFHIQMSHPARFPRCYVDPQNCRLSEHDIQGTTLFEWSSDYETPLYFSVPRAFHPNPNPNQCRH